MRVRALLQDEQTQDALFSTSLDAAIAAWLVARHAFQNEAGERQRDKYEATTNELGQAIAAWRAEQPEIAEQFGWWFLSHQEVWSVREPDGASEL